MKPNDFHSSEFGQIILTSKGYHAFLPAPLPPNLDWSSPLMTTLSETERDLSRLSTLADTFPFPRLLIQPFMRREAVLSSRIASWGKVVRICIESGIPDRASQTTGIPL